MKRILLTAFCLLLTGTTAVAQGHHRATSKSGVKRNSTNNCTESPTLVPDGTTSGVEDFIDFNAVAFYFENLKGGHSYSVEVWDPFDLYVGVSPVLSLLDSSTCSVPATYQDVTGINPNLSNAFADRISFIQPTDSAQQIGLSNPDTTNGYSFYIRITDTTLLNPRWSTFSGFITQYALVNNTSTDIGGTLTLTDSLGNQFATNLTIPAGQEIFETTSDLSIPANRFGFATFAFVGPAGAVTADAYFINPSATVIVPSTFAPINYQH